MVHFPIQDYWWIYLSFVLFVILVLIIDLGVFHKKAHVITLREATLWTLTWISLALLFNVALYFFTYFDLANRSIVSSNSSFNPQGLAQNLALQFLTGFLIEKALAVDNVFIFAMIFSYFSIPPIYQHRVLFWGIFGALFFRGLFIALGSVLMKYHFIVIFFGFLLIVTGVRMISTANQKTDLSQNYLLRKINKFFNVLPQIKGHHFFVMIKNKLYLTPLFVSLIFIELSDIIFAIDSVPAIFAITHEPLIVFTSNIFAILGLRSMYFMLSGAIDRFQYIKYGLSAVMIFVGFKMAILNQAYDGHFPTWLSLLIIMTILLISIIVSLLKKPRASLWT